MLLLFLRLFLHGLQKFGRGKWRKICWELLKTRTPTQVASHAQKYFERPKTASNRRRSSIHDIRLVTKSADVNTNNATLRSNYGPLTNSKNATPEDNYGQFVNSNNTTPSNCCWQFATSNNTTPNSNYGHFANNTLAWGSVFGPSICTEPVMPFGRELQCFNPPFQYFPGSNFEYGI